MQVIAIPSSGKKKSTPAPVIAEIAPAAMVAKKKTNKAHNPYKLLHILKRRSENAAAFLYFSLPNFEELY